MATFYDEPSLNEPSDWVSNGEKRRYLEIISRMSARMGGGAIDSISGLQGSVDGTEQGGAGLIDRVPLVSVSTTVDYTLSQPVLLFAKAAITVFCNSSPKNLETFRVKRLTTAGNVIIDGNGKNIDGQPTYTMLANYESRLFAFYSTDDAWYLI